MRIWRVKVKIKYLIHINISPFWSIYKVYLSEIFKEKKYVRLRPRRSMSPNGLYIWLVAIYRRSLQDLKMAILGGDS